MVWKEVNLILKRNQFSIFHVEVFCRQTNTLDDAKCFLLNIRKLKLGQEKPHSNPVRQAWGYSALFCDVSGRYPSSVDILKPKMIRTHQHVNISWFLIKFSVQKAQKTWPCSAVRSVSNCRSCGCESHPGPVPYFCGGWSWSWNNFYCPPFLWFSESMCT